MVRLLVCAGADLNVPYYDSEGERKTVWDLCSANGNDSMKLALKHTWTPGTHKKYPRTVRDAIYCVLLIAKRQRWPIPEFILFSIFGLMTAELWCSVVKKQNV